MLKRYVWVRPGQSVVRFCRRPAFAESLLAFCKTLRFILASMQFGVSHRSIWRQRVVGSLLVLPVEIALCFAGLLPLQGVQLLAFAVLFVVYLAALFARGGSRRTHFRSGRALHPPLTRCPDRPSVAGGLRVAGYVKGRGLHRANRHPPYR